MLGPSRSNEITSSGRAVGSGGNSGGITVGMSFRLSLLAAINLATTQPRFLSGVIISNQSAEGVRFKIMTSSPLRTAPEYPYSSPGPGRTFKLSGRTIPVMEDAGVGEGVMVEVGVDETGVSVGGGVMVNVGGEMGGVAVAVGVADEIDGGKGGSSGIFVGVGVGAVEIKVGESVNSTVGVTGVGGIQIK